MLTRTAASSRFNGGRTTNVPWYVSSLTYQNCLGYEAGDTNLYRYVGNGPTDATDPSGTEEERPRTFPNKQTQKRNDDDLKNLKGILKDKGADYLNKNVFEVKTVEELRKRVKPGEVFKYVIKNGKVIVILHGPDKKIPHSVGTCPLPITEANLTQDNIGQPVEAAGYARYVVDENGNYVGLRFDLKTGHYQINTDAHVEDAKTRANQVLKPWNPRYRPDVQKK